MNTTTDDTANQGLPETELANSQKDCPRTAIKPTHQWNSEDGQKPRRSNVEKWLFGILLLWPPFVLICDTVGTAVGMPFADYLVFFGSPVVAAILAGIAIRHYPATRKFLKTLVGLLLITTVLWGGFFQCASLAHKEKLRSTMKHTYFAYFDAKPLLSMPRVTLITYRSVVSQPLFPVSDADANATLRGALVGVFGYASLCLSPYTPMLGPYYLLLMLITSPFLAIPIFWLWVVLSVLYVVLPSRAWGWIGNTLRRGWSVIRRRTSGNAPV